jgi:hypothetical protein
MHDLFFAAFDEVAQNWYHGFFFQWKYSLYSYKQRSFCKLCLMLQATFYNLQTVTEIQTHPSYQQSLISESEVL